MTRKLDLSKAAPWLIVGALLALGLGLRLNRLTSPPFDFHPTRQLRSAIIARGMYYQMLPNADPTLRSQAMGYWGATEIFEPPIFERLVALTYLVTGEKLWIARIYSSLIWLVGGLALFGLARRLTNNAGGLTSLAFYLVLPFAVVASRSFQPDPAMVSLTLCGAYALYRWGETIEAPPVGSLPAGRLRRLWQAWGWTFVTGLLCGLAVLVKAMSLFSVAAAALGMVLASGKLLTYLRKPQTWVTAAVMAVIPGVYYLFLMPGAGSFTSFWTLSLAGLLTSTKFYLQWLALIRGLIDPGVVFAAFLGVLLIRGRGRGIALGLWAGYVLMGLGLPFQIYTHEYYSLPLVPAVALGLAPFAGLAWSYLRGQPRIWKAAFLISALAVMGYYAYVARSVVVASDNRSEVIAWQKMGQELPKDEPMIALTHDYGARLKYYAWIGPTRLWPEAADIQLAEAAGHEAYDDFSAYFAQQTQGMHYFLVTLFSSLDAQPQLKAELYDHYSIAGQGDGYVLFDLSKRK